MNNNNYNRFFDLVGNDSVNYNEAHAKNTDKTTFINDCMGLVNENPPEYGSVSEELESLAAQFWDSIN